LHRCFPAQQGEPFYTTTAARHSKQHGHCHESAFASTFASTDWTPSTLPSLMISPGLQSLPLWSFFDGANNRVAFCGITTLKNTLPPVDKNAHNNENSIPFNYEAGGEYDTCSTLEVGIYGGRIPRKEISQPLSERCHILDVLRKHELLLEGTLFGNLLLFVSSRSSIQAHTAPIYPTVIASPL